MRAAHGDRPRRSSPALTKRRASRLAAVQALYQSALGGDSEEVVVRQFADHRLGRDIDGDVLEADEAFFSEIVRGVAGRRAEIDGLIKAQLASGREVARLEVVLRAILEAAVYELLARGDVPGRVVIAEYVAIANDFFAESEAGLVNGVLDRMAHRLRAGEFEGDGGAR